MQTLRGDIGSLCNKPAFLAALPRRVGPLSPHRSFNAQPFQSSRQIREVRARDALDNIADALRPGIIPRPVAKGLILFFGATFVWSLVQKLLSFTVFLGLVGGGAYLFVKSKTAGIGDSFSGNSNNDKDGNGDNPLDSARRIMDKYK